MTQRQDVGRFFVWDLPTRVFHWLLFASVAAAYLTGGEDEGGLFALHVAAGYLIAALLVFRFLWGFVGSEHSRFGDFLPYPSRIREHLRGLLAGRPRHYAGHNPVGGLAVFAMIAILIAVLYTGLAASGEELHETFANLILVVAGLHVAGVIVESLLTGENLIPAMIHGRKKLPADSPEARDSRPAGAGRALAAIAAVVVAGVAGVASGTTPWPPTEAAFEREANEAAEREEHDDEEAFEDEAEEGE